MAPAVKDINVAVIPDARYLFNTIITNSAGANAHIPIIKLLINNIKAVFLSRDKCLIRLFIIYVFNVVFIV